MNKGRKMTERVPVAPETHERLKDFSFGMKTTFDGAINYLLDTVIDADDPIRAGRRVWENLQQSIKEEPEGKQKRGKKS